jgi:hypothetical protein
MLRLIIYWIMEIKVIKMPYFYKDCNGKLFSVFKVESNLDLLSNSYILDCESSYNGYKLPSIDHICWSLMDDYTRGVYDKIRSYIYVEDINDVVWLELFSLERDYKLSLILE